MPSRSQSRSRVPLGSMNGTPLACAIEPGAWLAITRRAVAEACRIGRGPPGRSAQNRHARASASSASTALGGGKRKQRILDLGGVLGLLLAETRREQGEMLNRHLEA